MKLVLMVLIFLGGINIYSQQINYKKFMKVVLADPGQLYSTYQFDSGDSNAVSVAMKGKKDLTNMVIEYSREDNWPDGLNTLDDRLALKEILITLKVYLIADLGDKYLIIVPQKVNRKTRIPFTRDIFFVVGKSGVELIK